MAGREYDHLFKLLMVGDSGVGKTSLLTRYTAGEYADEQRSTVGVDLKVKWTKTEAGERVKLTIWDTAGQERFRTLTSSYYRGAHGIVVAYDVTSRESFQNVVEWLKEIDIYSTRDDTVKLLVANKVDLAEGRAVSTQEGRDFARRHGMLFMECSAKQELRVTQAFDELVRMIMERPSLTGGDGDAAGAAGAGGMDLGYDEPTQACC